MMNCLALQDFEKAGVETRVQTAIAMGQVAEPYVPRRAIRHLQKGRVVIFERVRGAVLLHGLVRRTAALEIGCQAVLMGKNGVDGVYDAGPPDDPGRGTLRHPQPLRRPLAGPEGRRRHGHQSVSDNRLPLVVFDLMAAGHIRQAAAAHPVGTLVVRGSHDLRVPS
ncbi:MAG: hypothetical protein U0R27_05800 [Candidatus Nanopelagicales bacterium]